MFQEVCEITKDQKKIFLFDKINLKLKDAIKYCQNIGGIIFVTEDEEKTDSFISKSVNLKSQLHTYIFSGICTNSTNHWVNLNNNKPITWNIWKKVTFSYNDSLETKCLWYNFEDKTFSDNIISNSIQPICEIPRLRTFLLRGVCKDVNLDIYYTMESPSLFLGFIFSKISYSEERNKWELISTADNTVIAYTKANSSKPPIGANKWIFSNGKCQDETRKEGNDEFRTLHLHLEVEQPGYFCCSDGYCIKSEFVCDGTANCQEMEDEKDCRNVIVPKYYDRTKIPVKISYTEDEKHFMPVNVEVQVDILKIISFQDGSSFEVFYDISFQWFDESLKFEFLKDKDDANSLKNASMIWFPKIQFYHVKEEKILENKLTVKRNTKKLPIMSHDSDTVNVREIYHGQDSKLKLSLKITQEVVCSFDNVVHYPFKDEECQLHFFLEGGLTSFVNFEPLTINFKENQVVNQYKIKEWKIENSKHRNIIQISVVFSKQFSVIFLVTYLPTLLMNIINQATNYIENENKGRYTYFIIHHLILIISV